MAAQSRIFPHFSPDTLSSFNVCLLVTVARSASRLESAPLSLSDSLASARTGRQGIESGRQREVKDKAYGKQEAKKKKSVEAEEVMHRMMK